MNSANCTNVRTHQGRACGVDELTENQLRRLLEQPEQLLWRHIDRPVKISHTSLIVVADITLAEKKVSAAYKQYRPRNWRKSLLGWFRASRARRSWVLGRILCDRHVTTARPLAMCEPRGLLARRSYLATEWIDDAENLHLYAWRLTSCPIRERLRRVSRCAESLGRLLGRMHAAGIANRDLKAANLLVVDPDDRPVKDEPETYMIDPDGARVCRRLTPQRRAADLATLAVGLHAHPWITRTICWRFLRAYAGQFPHGTTASTRAARKNLWLDISARSRRIIRRMRRRREQIL